jgi:hypothetical protein
MTIAIVLVILVIIGAGGLIVLAPFTLTAEISVSETVQSGVMHAQWLHPWIMRWKYDVAQGRYEVTVLGKTCISPDKDGLNIKSEKSLVPGNMDKPAPAAAPPASRIFYTPEKEPLTGEKNGLNDLPSGTSDGKKPAYSRTSAWQKVKFVFSILRDGNNRRAFAKVLQWSKKTLGLFFKTIRFNHFKLYAKVGTGDPAETGKIYGYYTALEKSILSMHQKIDVLFTPEFSNDMFECCGSVAVRTSFARVLLLLLTALVTFPYLTAYFVWRRINKQRVVKE